MIKIRFSFKKILKYCFILWFLGVLFVASVNIYVIEYSRSNIKNNVDELEKTRVWLVLWALVYKNGSPSPVLEDRLIQAYNAYKNWKIEKIIVSGDNWNEHYNEPVNMQNYLVSLWVEKDDIYIDYAWFDTYDSFYRVKEIFWVDELIVFTQDFHLGRSVYIWNRLWIKTVWVSTDLREYYYIRRMEVREVLARIKAFLDVEIFKSEPKFLGEMVDMNVVQEKVE